MNAPAIPAPQDWRRFWLTHAVVPGLALALAILPFEVTDLDLVLSDPFYDFEARCWPHVEAFWAREVVHRWGKYFVWAVGLVPLTALLLSWRLPRLIAWRRTCLYIVLCMALSPAVVVLLKVLIGRHCPWAIERYGGDVAWNRLFDMAPSALSDGKPGRGFPAAHASSGLGLLCFYFAAYARGLRRPWLWALPGLLLGLVFAFGQQARGAHFFSHNLWSLAVCWGIALLVYRAFGGRL